MLIASSEFIMPNYIRPMLLKLCHFTKLFIAKDLFKLYEHCVNECGLIGLGHIVAGIYIVYLIGPT